MKFVIKGRKGQQANVFALVAGAVGIGILAIVLGLLSTVLTRIQATQTANNFDFNATQQGLLGLDQFSQFQTTIAIIIVSVFIIGLVLVGFAVGRR